MSARNDEQKARYERERDYHDRRYGEETRSAARRFYEVDGALGRYLATIGAAPAGARVLEYGCGTGSLAIELASRGVHVTGIDISPVAVERSTIRADEAGIRSVARFEVMNAEQMSFADDSFDIVCGTGILHHLDLDLALAEVARVLAPGGWALFYEPLASNPLINAYRRLTPAMRTPDEHPLTAADLAGLDRWFAGTEVTHHNLFALVATPFRRLSIGPVLARVLHRVDRWVFDHLPFMKRFAWVVLVRLEHPRPVATSG